MRNLWLGLLKHDYFLAIANLREKSKPGSFDMYADFTSGDGRLLVTFPASWANIARGEAYKDESNTNR